MTVGILGGMGPAAGVRLAELLTAATDGAGDASHISFLLYSPNDVPDRSDYLTAKSPTSPLPALRRGLELLISSGADVLVMACNTAHAFLAELRKTIPVPILDMPSLTVREAAVRGVKKAAILETEGARRAGVFENAFAAAGMDTILPTAEEQAVIDRTIRERKDGIALPSADFFRVCRRLLGAGADTLLLGCTELSLFAPELAARGFPISDTLLAAVSEILLLSAGESDVTARENGIRNRAGFWKKAVRKGAGRCASVL